MSDMERPYEKLEKYDPEFLSDSELIAIILRTGTKNKNSVDLAKELLKLCDDKIRDAFYLDKEDYMKIVGFGKVKALQMIAIGELIKRVEKPIANKEKIISSTVDAANYLMPEMRYLKKEQIVILFLDAKNAIKKKKVYSNNDFLSVELEPIQIIKDTLKFDMPNIIMAHNHPSGRIEPSKSDIIYTKTLHKLCGEFGIELLDHIIIGDGKFKSIMK